MPDVVLKGEMHISSQDLEEEQQILLEEDIDSCVFEGESRDTDPVDKENNRILSSIYELAGFLMRGVFIDRTPLFESAEHQNIPVKSTREQGIGWMKNSPIWVQGAAVLFGLVLVSVSLSIGVLFGNLFVGSLYFYMGVIGPVLIVRSYNMYVLRGETNRDQIIADMIVDSVDEHGTTFAIVGENHADGVRERLPEEITVEYRPPQYPVFSKQFVRRAFEPFVSVVGKTYLLYAAVYYTGILGWQATQYIS